jgi:hypothetical protein
MKRHLFLVLAALALLNTQAQAQIDPVKPLDKTDARANVLVKPGEKVGLNPQARL